MRLRRIATALIAGLFAWSAGAQAPTPAPHLDGVDVYGTERIDVTAVRKEFAADFDGIAAAIQAFDRDRAIALKGPITEAIRARGPFVFVNLTIIFNPPPNAGSWITIDVVEAKDATRRMPFRAPPQGHVGDPNGALAVWEEYDRVIGKLFREGRMKPVLSCPALHCLSPFDLPETAPLLPRLDAAARGSKAPLMRIVRDDADPKRRAEAIFLLAHAGDPAAVLPLLGQAMFDADQEVRNNAMRVLVYVAQAARETAVPVEDLVRALDFPTATDRNKAGFAVAALVASPLLGERSRKAVLANGLPAVMGMLKLIQPNNRDPAWRILMTLSGEEHTRLTTLRRGKRGSRSRSAFAENACPHG